MTPDATVQIPARLHALAVTALLLERLDRSPHSASGASAEQYQGLVRQIDHLLDEAESEPALPQLLERLPALAELHENRHYAEAGLCRSPLDAAVQAEQAAAELIRRVRGTR